MEKGKGKWRFTSPTHVVRAFARTLKVRGFVIYPGKVTEMDTFRIGNIGDIHLKDMERLVDAIRSINYHKPFHGRDLPGDAF